MTSSLSPLVGAGAAALPLPLDDRVIEHVAPRPLLLCG
jgi:hypothetical protein